MQLYDVGHEDAGRYICEMTTPDHTVTENYMDVKIKRKYRQKRRHYRDHTRRFGEGAKKTKSLLSQ